MKIVVPSLKIIEQFFAHVSSNSQASKNFSARPLNSCLGCCVNFRKIFWIYLGRKQIFKRVVNDREIRKI